LDLWRHVLVDKRELWDVPSGSTNVNPHHCWSV
jgi:hypothetical protein